MIAELTAFVAAGGELGPDRIARAVAALTDEALAPEAKADFLVALARKGETPAEISGFAAELRARAVPLPVPAAVRQAGVLDVVGTGGDRAGTLNLSTAAALIAAAAGVHVAKHGNRAVTSKSGSADVLQALGIPTELAPEQAATRLERHGFAFLFAPLYHPAFRAIAPARKLCAERGERTLFNLLGPLLNPARPTYQLMGVPAPSWCEPLAWALQRLGVRRAMVVCGAAGSLQDGTPRYLDEVSPVGPTTVASFRDHRPVETEIWLPEAFPLQAASLDDLRGGDATANARQLRRILAGEERGPQRDAVLLNAAAALLVADRVSSMAEGWARAVAVVDRGDARRKLAELGGA